MCMVFFPAFLRVVCCLELTLSATGTPAMMHRSKLGNYRWVSAGGDGFSVYKKVSGGVEEEQHEGLYYLYHEEGEWILGKELGSRLCGDLRSPVSGGGGGDSNKCPDGELLLHSSLYFLADLSILN